MEPAPARPRDEAIDHDDLLVHEWRVTQLARLGDPMVAGTVRGRPRRLAPGRNAGAARLPATACAPDRQVRQSP
jgi:hypothetical protein